MANPEVLETEIKAYVWREIKNIQFEPYAAVAPVRPPPTPASPFITLTQYLSLRRIYICLHAQ